MAKDITVHFEKSDDYKMVPATGAWGGPIASGDIAVEFYVEKRTTPELIRYKVEPPKSEEIERSGERIIREIQVGILLRPETAHVIGKWLIEKAQQAGYREVEDAH